MIIGYARVSSRTQLKGNSLEEQEKELLENGCQKVIFEQYTGKTTDRPLFKQLKEKTLQNGDTLMVCKLDRLARTVPEGIETVKFLFSKGVKVHVLNVGLLENTPMGDFFFTTLLAVAELERCMILERTAAGKEIARSKPGYRDGRPPKFTTAQLEWASQLKAEGYSYKEIERMTQISKSTLQRFLWRQKLPED